MTPQEVADRLLEMGTTLRRLHVRGCWPAGYESSWPSIVHTQDELFGAVRQRIGELEAMYKAQNLKIPQERLIREAYDGEHPRPDPPQAGAITRMDEAIGWIGLIEHRLAKVQFGVRRTIWMKALGIKNGKISRRLGVSRETIRAWWWQGCEDIAKKLNRNSVRISPARPAIHSPGR